MSTFACYAIFTQVLMAVLGYASIERPKQRKVFSWTVLLIAVLEAIIYFSMYYGEMQ